MPPAIFQVGDQGPVVAEIRARLARLGLLEGSRHVRAEQAVGSLMHSEGPAGGDPTAPAQWETTALASGVFDEDLAEAVRRFQRERGIGVDGIVGPETFRRLEEARWQLGDRVLSYQPGHLFIGDDVLQLQRHLNRMGFDCGKEDAQFGPDTDRGLREFQRNVGAVADGIAGHHTLRALGRLHRTVGKQSAHTARERYALAKLQTGVVGKTVVLDLSPGDSPAVRAASSIARSTSLELAKAGAVVVWIETTDPGGEPLDELERAQAANNSDPDLVLSLQADTSDQDAPRLAAYYFGRSDGVFSAAGRAAAEAIRDALAERDLGPCAIDARTGDILRATRMPSVRVVLGGEGESDGQQLEDPQFQHHISAAIARGLGTFFAPPEDPA